MKNALGTKIYYSISEVADITDLQPYTLRAWEKEFSCLRPRRARGKNRAYRERDIGIIQLIKQLLYEEGYTTKGVKQKLKNEPELLQITTFKPIESAPIPPIEEEDGLSDTAAGNAGAAITEPEPLSREIEAEHQGEVKVKDEVQVQRVLADVRNELRAILEIL